MMKYNIAVVPGDGIGPEVTAEAVKALRACEKRYDIQFDFGEVLAGGAAIDKFGICLPDDTVQRCREADAVLLGAVGGPKWDAQPPENRPEKALLGLRKSLGLYANLRPAMIFPELADASPLKSSLLEGGLDIMIVRELTGGIYFGEHASEETGNGKIAWDVEKYSEPEIRRIVKKAFRIASVRNRRVTSVDKANVLSSSRLWREVVSDEAESWPDVSLDCMYVDNAAMQLIRDPKHFDVLVTSNMFGDILSDEASQITGSIGMLPSASLADGTFGMYEPVHGSAPDIAGTGRANPMAAVLSASMMLRYSLDESDAADAVDGAVRRFLADGYRTADISTGDEYVSTEKAGDIIASYIENA